jgi:hypothetical protein
LFPPNEGKDLGSVRVIQISPDDPRFPRIGELQRTVHEETNNRTFFFAGWDIRYRYTKEELNNAEAFKLWPIHTFEPPGELCGTIYDNSTACPECGAGAAQVSDLRLDLRKAPKSKDIARTIASEIIVSQRFAALLSDGDFKGFELRPVRHKSRYEDDPVDLHEVPSGREILQQAKAAGAPHPTGRFWVWLNRSENRDLYEQAWKEYVALKHQERRSKGEAAPVWYQLIVLMSVEIVAPTRVGINPFDEDAMGECRCSRGDTIGLNLLSELWISKRDFANCKSDIACTKQHIGVRRGLLRPAPLLVISPTLWRALEKSEIKGFRVEVAHLK